MIELNKQSHTAVTPMNNKHFTKSIIQIQTFFQILFAFWTHHDKRKEIHVWGYERFLCKIQMHDQKPSEHNDNRQKYYFCWFKPKLKYILDIRKHTMCYQYFLFPLILNTFNTKNLQQCFVQKV